MATKGADYSWDRPDLNCLWNQGVRFIVRYGSRDPSKNLAKAELDAALARGMGVCVVWQEGKTQMTRGYSGGQTDARDADAFVNGLGLPGIPVYFSCDQDFEACSSADKSAIDAYCDGAASVIGKSRMGGYGDDSFCKRQFDAGRITWGWQTYAWSEGMWEQRCQLRQVLNNQSVCGGYIDWDEAHAADYGQWPRPAGAQPQPEEDEMIPAVALDAQGRAHRAKVGTDGKIYYAGPGVSGWRSVDPGANVKGGVSIAVSGPAVNITYVNAGSHICSYHLTSVDGWNWGWADHGQV
jgi:Rv2525c-like, glycoside hydrolase-like domain